MIETSWAIAISGLLLGCFLVAILKLMLSKGTPRSSVRSNSEIRKLAHMGCPDAQYHLGFMYEAGIGRQPHKGKSFYWYLRSAESCHAGSFKKISQYYMEGMYVDEDLNKGVWWMTPGNEDAKSSAAREMRVDLDRKYPKTPYSFMNDKDYKSRK